MSTQSVLGATRQHRPAAVWPTAIAARTLLQRWQPAAQPGHKTQGPAVQGVKDAAHELPASKAQGIPGQTGSLELLWGDEAAVMECSAPVSQSVVCWRDVSHCTSF
jgi:hypothetical protein